MVGTLPDRVRHYRAGGEETVISELPPRPPGPAEVLLEVTATAIGARPGAEVLGVVIAAGESATEWLGRHVIAPALLPCGECPHCRRGRGQLCPQAPRRDQVQSHETLPARFLLPLAPPLPFDLRSDDLWRLAALADAALGPYTALVRLQLAPGDLCVVVGAGLRGCFTLAVARGLGAEVVVLDGDQERRRRALERGARLALDTALLDGPGALAELTQQAAALGLARAERRIVESTGTAAGRLRALALLGEGGSLALLGDGTTGVPALAQAPFVDAGATIAGVPVGHPDLLPELAARVARGDLDLAALTSPFPFAALGGLLAARRRGELHTLPVLRPSA